MIHRVNVEFPDVYILVRLYRNFSRPWDEFHQSILPAISSIQENIDNYRGNVVVLLNDDSWTDDEAALKEHQSMLQMHSSNSGSWMQARYQISSHGSLTLNLTHWKAESVPHVLST